MAKSNMAKSKEQELIEKAIEQQSKMLEYAEKFMGSDKMNPTPFTMPEPAKVDSNKASDLATSALIIVRQLEGLTVFDALEILRLAEVLISKDQIYVAPARV